MAVCNKLMANLSTFTKTVDDPTKKDMCIKGIGVVEIGHLRKFKDILQPAFELKMRATAYWKIVLGRLVDFMALHLLLSIHNLVDEELESEVISELMGDPARGGGIERLLGESPAVARKREKLNRSISCSRNPRMFWLQSWTELLQLLVHK